jgi:hypothetical protein
MESVNKQMVEKTVHQPELNAGDLAFLPLHAHKNSIFLVWMDAPADPLPRSKLSSPSLLSQDYTWIIKESRTNLRLSFVLKIGLLN